MTTFLQLHLLTSYPPANLNRDDLGRPKQARMGGVNRLRVSSQSLKRAWRCGSVFESALADHLGIRTKRLGCEAYVAMRDAGMDEKKATAAAHAIASVFGTPNKDKKANKEKLEHLHISTVTHVAPEERDAVASLTKQLAAENRTPTEEELQLLRKDISAADIALFGRMLAAAPAFNIDAACQVAHALTVHKAIAEDDFFTAVDDLNDGEEARGSGHMGDTEFGAGLFYLYLCVDVDQLARNLQGNTDLCQRTLGALVEAACTVSPTGKQNSFGSRAYASYCLAERGSKQPRNLSAAFLSPVTGQDNAPDAIARLNELRGNMDAVYGACADDTCELNVLTGSGSLAEVKNFAAESCRA